MKKSIFLFLLFSTIVIFGQKTLNGKVVSNAGNPLASASITIEEVETNTILAYGISNSKGEFKVNFNTNSPNIELKIKAYNNQPYRRVLKNETQSGEFRLSSDVTEIKEVTIKTKLITKKGDTIAYDLKSFESQSDRTLADVLKKLPGIEVKSDGTILYQGEPLNKFYVEGKDLMEGGYGLVNNSLPKDAVSKVEILENHQPVKVLQDKVASDKAAINIKLKKKITLTGRGEVGAGFSPLLWNVKLTPMFFSKKNQWVMNYKANNMGESVEREGNILAFGNDWEGRRSQVAPYSWLGVDNATTPSIPEKRYLFNNVHYLSANMLFNPFKNKDWEMKLNANYINNAVERESFSETRYEPSDIFPNGAVNSTKIANNYYTNSAKGEMILLKNAKSGFFKNITSWNGFWNENQALDEVINSQSKNYSIDEGVKSPTFNISNSLSTIIPWKDKMINLKSYISYQRDRQNLWANYQNFNEFDALLDTSKISTLHQRVQTNVAEVNHSVSVGLTYKKWTFTPEMGLNMSFNDMDSRLYFTGEKSGSSVSHLWAGNNFSNQFSWNQINPYTELELNYKGSALNMNFQLPVNFYGIEYKNKLNPTHNMGLNKVAFTPSFWGYYEFASFFKWFLNGYYSQNFGAFGDVYSGYILDNPQIINNNNSPLPINKTLSGGSRLEYRNPLNNLFFNISYRYTKYKRNTISLTYPNPNSVTTNVATITERIAYDNAPFRQSQSAEIGKYFPSVKTNISLSAGNSDSNSFTLIELAGNRNLYETKNNTQTAGFKFNNTYLSWFSIDYNLTANWYKNRNLNQNTTNKYFSWGHALSAYIYPSKGHTIGFFWDNSSFEQSGNVYRNSFYDISYQFTWVKKKIDFEVKWLNIANTKVYERISYSPVYLSTSQSLVYIRPSQVMFSIKFNFK